MGIAIYEIPEIGGLAPVQRREFARWLRSVVARDKTISAPELRRALASSSYAGCVQPEDLVSIGWLGIRDGALHADTYARRIAAGAVDGERMSEAEAVALALKVRDRISERNGEMCGVRIVRAVLYGSAVRSVGNLKADIGDLDLALELEVSARTAEKLAIWPEDSRWRTALALSGWDKVLMEGDDRVTLAGSLTKVLQLFNRQLNGLDIPADGRMPCLVTLWESVTVRKSADCGPARPSGWAGSVPALVSVAASEVQGLPDALMDTLQFLEASSKEHERASRMADAAARWRSGL